METVKIEPLGVNVGGNQHSTVWPGVGAMCPDNTQLMQPLSTEVFMYARPIFIAFNLELGCGNPDIK